MPDLSGQTVMVIGGSAGIGLETARAARAEGADVYAPVREFDFDKTPKPSTRGPKARRPYRTGIATNFIVNGRFKPHAVRDGHLITGQQQYSGVAATRLLIDALGT